MPSQVSHLLFIISGFTKRLLFVSAPVKGHFLTPIPNIVDVLRPYLWLVGLKLSHRVSIIIGRTSTSIIFGIQKLLMYEGFIILSSQGWQTGSDGKASKVRPRKKGLRSIACRLIDGNITICRECNVARPWQYFLLMICFDSMAIYPLVRHRLYSQGSAIKKKLLLPGLCAIRTVKETTICGYLAVA